MSDTEPGHVSLGSRRSTPERRLSDYAVTNHGQVNTTFLMNFPQAEIFLDTVFYVAFSSRFIGFYSLFLRYALPCLVITL